jgi:hypothetical protein
MKVEVDEMEVEVEYIVSARDLNSSRIEAGAMEVVVLIAADIRGWALAGSLRASLWLQEVPTIEEQQRVQLPKIQPSLPFISEFACNSILLVGVWRFMEIYGETWWTRQELKLTPLFTLFHLSLHTRRHL